MSAEIEQKIRAAYLSGRHNEAVAAAKSAAGALEDAPIGLYYWAHSEIALGRMGEADAILKRVVAKWPDYLDAQSALARLLMVSGGDSAAPMAALATAALSNPLASVPYSDALVQAGRFEDAYVTLAKAAERDGSTHILNRLCEAAMRTGRIDPAKLAAERLEAAQGMTAQVAEAIGPVALGARDQEWTDRCVKALESYPPPVRAGVFDIWLQTMLAGALLEAAVEAARLAANAHPTPARWRLVADLAFTTQIPDEAEKAAQKALALDRNDATAMSLIARKHLVEGDLEEAKRILVKSIEADPNCTPAYHSLAKLDPAALNAAMRMRVNELTQDDSLSEASRARILLTAAAIKEHDGEHAGAFRDTMDGKAIMANIARVAGRGYDPARTEERIRDYEEIFAEPLRPVDVTAPPRIIFIVGMPRSGTTLTEQILSSHAEVFGAGELSSMIRIDSELTGRARTRTKLLQMLESDGARYALEYRDLLPAEAAGFGVVTDKHPLNFWGVGLARAILPGAIFIDSRRDAEETCLSILKHPFFRSYDFANEIDAVAHYYAAYERIMRFWFSQNQPDLIAHSYEKLVDDPETQIRQLLGDCNLSFDPACLASHKTKRTVITHSAVQVREPINKRAIGRKNKYGEALEPLREALDKHRRHFGLIS